MNILTRRQHRKVLPFSISFKEAKEAVTSIWPIKGRVDQVIHYARNPEKTTEASGKKLHEIEGIVDYAADDLKTERCTYVTGINLDSVETAAEFMEVKQMEGKLGGRVCYHGYQSFREDEVDADTAHKIGVALASELWGDRFQVVVATHCNTNLIYAGLDPKTVQYLAGHENSRITMDIYAKVKYNNPETLSNAVCNAFSKLAFA